MLKRVLGAILVVVFVSALGAIVLPWGMAFWGGAFPGRLAFSAIFSLVALERTWAMFSRAPMRDIADVGRDWTAVTVAVSYTLVMYGVLIVFHAKRTGPTLVMLSVIGFATYGSGVLLRHWAFRHLRHQWVVHVDRGGEDRRLVTTGPYHLIRHPLYLGACLEAIGLPLAFNTFLPLLLAAVAFIPCEVHRAYFEEAYLRQTFGDEYSRYAARTWAFVPLPFGKPNSTQGGVR